MVCLVHLWEVTNTKKGGVRKHTTALTALTALTTVPTPVPTPAVTLSLTPTLPLSHLPYQQVTNTKKGGFAIGTSKKNYKTVWVS